MEPKSFIEMTRPMHKEKEIGPIVTHDFPIISHKLKESKWDKVYWFLYGIFARPFKNATYHLRQRFINKLYLIDTKLDRGKYYDTDSRMLYGMMSLLCQYIEIEKPMESINWTDDDHHFNAYFNMMDCYIWWKNYENRTKEIDRALDTWYASSKQDKNGDWLANLNKPQSVQSEKLFKHLHDLENQLEKEEEEMLVRLVRIRKYLWT